MIYGDKGYQRNRSFWWNDGIFMYNMFKFETPVKLPGKDTQWKVGYVVSSSGERSGILDNIIYKLSEIIGADEPLKKSHKMKGGWIEEEPFKGRQR